MLERSLELVASGGSLAVVTPQAWLFAGSFATFRKRWLTTDEWNSVARLGPGAFDSISGEVVNVALLTVTRSAPRDNADFAGLDCETCRGASEKSDGLLTAPVLVLWQSQQLDH